VQPWHLTFWPLSIQGDDATETAEYTEVGPAGGASFLPGHPDRVLKRACPQLFANRNLDPIGRHRMVCLTAKLGHSPRTSMDGLAFARSELITAAGGSRVRFLQGHRLATGLPTSMVGTVTRSVTRT
jgi:hypothetical protein